MLEFRKMIQEQGGGARINVFGFIIYIIVYGVYLLLLDQATMHPALLLVLALKFLATTWLGFWVAREMMMDRPYKRFHHNLTRLDNVVNILFAVGIVYFLLNPLSQQ